MRVPRCVVAAALTAMAVAGCSGDDAADVSPTSTAGSTVAPSTGSAPRPTDTGAPAADGSATTVPAAPRLGDPIATLEEPVDLAVRPGDTALYVVERAGRVRAVRDGSVSGPLLDITDLTQNEGERGLLGLAFSTDGDLAYVDYTDDDGDTVIAEYPVGADGTFDEAGARTVLTVDQPYSNHNGGAVVTGPDGLLYIGMGDGGAADDPERHALDLGSLLGKILRIDPRPQGSAGYAVPDDNPFVDAPGARPEIWTIGVRNPWRLSFDAETGDLWVADVGQNRWEEVDLLPADPSGRNAGRGASLGWSAREGRERFNVDQPDDGHTDPVYVYEHGDDGCSISGGALYRGGDLPALDGWYVFGDYCSGKVWALALDGEPERIDIGTLRSVVAVRTGPDGELYALSLEGEIRPIS